VSDSPQRVVAAAEFLLEGLVAHRKLSRSEQREFTAPERTPRKQERAEPELDYDDWQQPTRRSRRGGYN
jgi:magnesium chelatase subunit I